MARNEDRPELLDAEEAFERGDVEGALIICEGLLGTISGPAPLELLCLAAECFLELQEPKEALHMIELARERLSRSSS